MITAPTTAAAGSVGDSIRFIYTGTGISVDLVGTTGTITRFTRKGNPVIAFRFDLADRTVTDTSGSAALIGPDGNLIR